jgi:low temperature requirement protein LtrA
MNFGDNIFDIVQSQGSKLFLAGMVLFAIVMIFKREFSKLIGFTIVCMALSVFVFAPDFIASVGQKLFKAILG